MLTPGDIREMHFADMGGSEVETRLSYTGAEMEVVVADRDRLRSQLAALSQECGHSCAREMKAANDERDRLRKFVQLVRDTDPHVVTTTTASMVRLAVKWLDEQEVK